MQAWPDIRLHIWVRIPSPTQGSAGWRGSRTHFPGWLGDHGNHTCRLEVPNSDGAAVIIAVLVRWGCWQIWVVAILIFEFHSCNSGSLIGLMGKAQQILNETVSLGRKLNRLVSQDEWEFQPQADWGATPALPLTFRNVSFLLCNKSTVMRVCHEEQTVA